MNRILGPLDQNRRVPACQQTRIAAFLISAHAALARQFAFAAPLHLHTCQQAELNAQFYREVEIVALLIRTASWVPDITLPASAILWETAWLPRPLDGIEDRSLALAAGVAILTHAVHAVIRPAILLPAETDPLDPFASALRRIEYKSNHQLQAQLVLLKSASFMPFRNVITNALDRRHADIRKLWDETLDSAGIDVTPADCTTDH